MHHIFIIHSSALGYLGCVHWVATVSKAAMNMDVQVSVEQDADSSGILWVYGSVAGS